MQGLKAFRVIEHMNTLVYKNRSDATARPSCQTTDFEKRGV
jgi:hypothetical protein